MKPGGYFDTFAVRVTRAYAVVGELEQLFAGKSPGTRAGALTQPLQSRTAVMLAPPSSIDIRGRAWMAQ